MNDIQDAAGRADALPRSASRLYRLVQRAPGPETPTPRDRAGAQAGMILTILGGGLFWAAMAALALYLRR